MDPNPKNYPILSYVLTRLPSIGSIRSPRSPSLHVDIENPPISDPDPNPDPTFHDTLISRMPHLKDPKLISEMSSTVSKISQTRSVLHSLGERPDHESVDSARSKLAEIESQLNRNENAENAENENCCREGLERERTRYRAIVQVDETHEAYERLLRKAEEKLRGIYEAKAKAEEEKEEGDEEVNEEVVMVLKEGKGVEKVELCGKKLRILPEAFGRLVSVLSLDLSANQLQVCV